MLNHAETCACSICGFNGRIRAQAATLLPRVCDCGVCKANREKVTNVGAFDLKDAKQEVEDASWMLDILDQTPGDLSLTNLGALCAKIGDYDRLMKVLDAMQELVGGKS